MGISSLTKEKIVERLLLLALQVVMNLTRRLMEQARKEVTAKEGGMAKE